MITYTEKGIGLHAAIQQAGHWLIERDGVWTSDDDAAVQSIIDGYDGLELPRGQKLAAIEAKFGAIFAAGMNYTGTDGVKRAFQIDPISCANINGESSKALAVKGGAAAWPSGYYWIAADNSHMPLLTADDMIGFGLAVGNYVSACVVNRRTLKDQVAAATTVTAVQAVDETAGWPSNP